MLEGVYGPSFSMEEKEGFQTIVGTSSTVTSKTGETHHSPAASIVLFGKDNKVLWSAP